MLEPLIKAIQGAVKPEIIVSADREFSSQPLHRIPSLPTVSSIKISTLTGLSDYISKEVDTVLAAHAAGDEPLHIEVLSPARVQLVGEIRHDTGGRDCYLVSDCSDFIGSGFEFDRFVSLEKFIIGIQANFVETEASVQMLSIVGSIVDSNVTENNDDGVTQTAVTRAGITRKENSEIPNPVYLRPYRTFPEVDQHESPFVLRLKKMTDNSIGVGLFAAGGGKWKCDAVQAIKQYLENEELGVPVLG